MSEFKLLELLDYESYVFHRIKYPEEKPSYWSHLFSEWEAFEKKYKGMKK